MADNKGNEWFNDLLDVLPVLASGPYQKQNVQRQDRHYGGKPCWVAAQQRAEIAEDHREVNGIDRWYIDTA